MIRLNLCTRARAQVHVAYQTSGCIAVADHDVLRHLSFVGLLAHSLGAPAPRLAEAAAAVRASLAHKRPAQVPRACMPPRPAESAPQHAGTHRDWAFTACCRYVSTACM